LALKKYFKEIGVPERLICDRATEQVKGDSNKLCHDAGCTVVELEKNTPASNRAERTIKILKDETKNDLFKSNSPMILWEYALERRAKIICSTPRSNHLLNGMTPHTKLTGQVTDISNLVDFGWYDWIIYHFEGQKFPFQHQMLQRVLGPSNHAGSMMSQWVLTKAGEVMPIQTLQKVTESERNSETMKLRMKEFKESIKKRLGYSSFTPEHNNEDAINAHDINDEDIIYESHYSEENMVKDPKEIDDVLDPNQYMDAEVMLPKDGAHLQAARVIGRCKDKNGRVIGLFNKNPILNTQIYDVMFPDGSVKQYAANIIAENIFAQIDEYGYRYQLLKNIINHKKGTNAIKRGDEWIISQNGNRSRKHTTKGWYFEVE